MENTEQQNLDLQDHDITEKESPRQDAQHDTLATNNSLYSKVESQIE